MSASYDDIRDFIVLHYAGSPRRDTPFWRAYTEEVKLSDTLAGNMALWETRPAAVADLQSPLALFANANYNFIMAGLDLLPKTVPNDGLIDLARSRAIFKNMADLKSKVLGHHPDHREYLTKVRGTYAGASGPLAGPLAAPPVRR